MTVSLDELHRLAVERSTPPTELGELWTMKQICAAVGKSERILREAMVDAGVRSWSLGCRRWYCAADVMKAMREGKL